MTHHTEIIALRAAFAVYMAELDHIGNYPDRTTADAVMRVSIRKMTETLAISEAKQEGFVELGERIIDLTTELKGVQ